MKGEPVAGGGRAGQVAGVSVPRWRRLPGRDLCGAAQPGGRAPSMEPVTKWSPKQVVDWTKGKRATQPGSSRSGEPPGLAAGGPPRAPCGGHKLSVSGNSCLEGTRRVPPPPCFCRGRGALPNKLPLFLFHALCGARPPADSPALCRPLPGTRRKRTPRLRTCCFAACGGSRGCGVNVSSSRRLLLLYIQVLVLHSSGLLLVSVQRARCWCSAVRGVP